jgi:hypothetical protein
MKTIFNFLSILLFSLILFNKVSANPLNLFISSVSPSMNAVSVNKSSNITIIFTQDMNAASVNGANIKVFGYMTGLLPVTIDYNPISKTANINPNQDFKTGEKISITLTSGLKTLSNVNIIPFIFSFTVHTIGGNGYFTKTSSIDFPEGYAFRSGDIDGDGDVDLLINNKIFKNNGKATFTYYTTLSNFIYGSSELADFDNDGDLDILIGSDNNLYLYLNNSTGDFTQTATFPGATGAFGDLNGDGYIDISYFESMNTIRVLRNVIGNFSLDPTVFITENANSIDNILIDDFDNDGDLDVIGINYYFYPSFGFFDINRYFNELKNNGSGELYFQSIYNDHFEHLGNVGIEIQNSKTNDINNDGYIDIITPGRNLYNNGTGMFSFNSGNILFTNSQTGDFNGDGIIDILASIFSAPLQTSLNKGNGDFTRFIGNIGHFARFSTSADFDNDGDLDVAIKEYGSNQIAILLNGDVPLPVELNSFVSETKTNTVNLKWSTSSEENNSGFDIERSTVKGQTPGEWIKISFIQGHGTTSSQINYEFIDRNLNSGKYKYRLKQIDFNGNFKYYVLANEVVIGSPEKYELSQNYPNPFNPVTHLGFGISNSGFVSLKVYDVLGNEIKTLVNEIKPAGYYEVEFNGSNLPSGIYYYKIETESFSQVKKMMIVK